MRREGKGGLALALTLSLTAMLTSCAAGAPTGRTVEQASTAAAAVEGVAEATVQLRNYRSGFTSKWGTTVNFTPSPTFENQDKSAVLQELLRIGWSVNEHKLDNGVALSVGRQSDVNLIELAREANLPSFASNPHLPYQITFSTSSMKQLFGAWPGE